MALLRPGIQIYDFSNREDKRNRTLGIVGKLSRGFFVIIAITLGCIHIRDIVLPTGITKILIICIFIPLGLLFLSIIFSSLQGILYMIGKIIKHPYENTLLAKYIEKFVAPFLPRYRKPSKKNQKVEDIRLIGMIRIPPFISIYYGILIITCIFIIIIIRILAQNPNLVERINTKRDLLFLAG